MKSLTILILLLVGLTGCKFADFANNVSPFTSLSTLVIVTPGNGAFITSADEASFPIAGTCTEAGQTVTFSNGVGTAICDGTNFTVNLDFSALPEEPFTLQAYITDPSGTIISSNVVNLIKTTGSAAFVFRTMSNSETVQLPLNASFNYNFYVDWGDGSPLAVVTGAADPDANHMYATAGDYTVTWFGQAEALSSSCVYDAVSNSVTANNLIIVPNLGNMGWVNLSEAFMECRELTSVAGGDLSQVTSITNMFREARLATVDTSGWGIGLSLTTMAGAFRGARAADPNTTGWVTSNVTDMSRVFLDASIANPDVATWDVSSVTTMEGMFADTILANPDVALWDVSSVFTFNGMFQNTNAANPNVSNWNMVGARDLYYMFKQAQVANPDVSTWITTEFRGVIGMFSDTPIANPNVSGWDTGKMNSFQSMFFNAASASPDVSGWDTGSATSMKNMFRGAPLANPVMSNFDFSSLVDPDAFENIILISGISNLNYSDLLIRLNDQNILPKRSVSPSDLETDAQYLPGAATTARANLVANGWVIMDNGQQ